jgi:hypothetical protein
MKWWLCQMGRALSRLINAIFGGEGDTTFSAYSYELALWGDTRTQMAIGRWRVWVIDGFYETVFKESDHCLDAWVWHQERRLFERDCD